MSYYKLPGPLCIGGALRPDVGTLVRATTPPPGPHGTNAERAILSEYDRDTIQRYAGRDFQNRNAPFPLGTLLRLHADHLRRYQEAPRDSYTAGFELATIERLAELIAEKRTHRATAAESLAKVLDPQHPGSDQQISKAVAAVLLAERQSQLRGQSTGEEAMALVAEAATVVAERRQEKLEKLLAEARRPGSRITDSQISGAVTAVLGAERQKQLLGVEDGPSRAMDLLGEAVELNSERHEKRLKDLIERAKRSGSKVTDEQIRKEVGEVLGAERQKQLLGLTDDGNDAEAATLIQEAFEVHHKRKKAELRHLIAKSNKTGGTVSRVQLRQEVAALLADERQSQLMGYDDEADHKEVWELFEQAQKVYNRKTAVVHKPRPKPKKEFKGLVMDPLYFIRSPFR